MVKRRFIFLLILLSVMVVSLARQVPEQIAPACLDTLAAIEMETLTAYMLSWQDEEECICSSVSRSRKNIPFTTSEKSPFSCSVHSPGKTRRDIVTCRYIPISCSLLCVYRI